MSERSPNIHPLEEADIALGTALASRKDHPAIRMASGIGKLGDQEPLYAAASALIVLSLATRCWRMLRAGVATLTAVAVADAGKTLAKRAVRRSRPNVLLDDGRYVSERGGSDQKPEQSFPSGHVACTVAAARAVTRHYPSAAPWGAAAVGVIALARMAKGAHWPLDVAAGLLIGLGAEAAANSSLKAAGLTQRSPD